MSSRALIIGITGQDGSYLSEHLLAMGYEVHGALRSGSRARLAASPFGQAPRLEDEVDLHEADLLDPGPLTRVLREVEPHEIYNLGAQSSVRASFEQPLVTFDVNAMGTVRLLEAVRLAAPSVRLYQAGSSEMFGSASPPQNEDTPFHPRSPYAVSKVAAFWATVNYRETYGVHASNGILFNHDSERRPPEFVLRKVSRAAARISVGQQEELRMGNLAARRDWGHAADHVRAMRQMLQLDTPVDLVVGTGESHTVEEAVEVAFRSVQLDWRDHVVVDPDLYRPLEVNYTEADASRARERLGWQPRISFAQLVERMVQHDLAEVARG